MTSTPDAPEHDGSDLAELREEIDALKAIPHEEIVNPLPKNLEDREPDAAADRRDRLRESGTTPSPGGSGS